MLWRMSLWLPRRSSSSLVEKRRNPSMSASSTPRLAKPCPWRWSLRRTRWLVGRSHGQSRPRQRHQSLLLHQPQTARRRGRRNSNSAPFAKKEVRRRKKVEDESMREVPQEDLKLQGIFLQHLKASQDLGYEEVKNYLIGTAPKDMKEFLLNPYWGRPACGAKSKALASGKKMPEVTYIGKFGTASCWNVNVVLCYISASLMASWLKSFSVQRISWEIGPMSGHLIFYNTLKFKPVLIILISFQLHVDTLIILASVVCNLLFSCLDVWCIYLIYTSTSSGLQANISTHSFLLIWGCLDGKREHGPGGDCKVEWPYRSHKATGNFHEV